MGKRVEKVKINPGGKRQAGRRRSTSLRTKFLVGENCRKMVYFINFYVIKR